MPRQGLYPPLFQLLRRTSPTTKSARLHRRKCTVPKRSRGRPYPAQYPALPRGLHGQPISGPAEYYRFWSRLRCTCSGYGMRPLGLEIKRGISSFRDCPSPFTACVARIRALIELSCRHTRSAPATGRFLVPVAIFGSRYTGPSPLHCRR